MATRTKKLTLPTAKLSAKHFSISPTGNVIVKDAQIKKMLAAELKKAKLDPDTKAIRITIGVDF